MSRPHSWPDGSQEFNWLLLGTFSILGLVFILLMGMAYALGR